MHLDSVGEAPRRRMRVIGFAARKRPQRTDGRIWPFRPTTMKRKSCTLPRNPLQRTLGSSAVMRRRWCGCAGIALPPSARSHPKSQVDGDIVTIKWSFDGKGIV